MRDCGSLGPGSIPGGGPSKTKSFFYEGTKADSMGGRLSDERYLIDRVLQECPTYTKEEEKTAFTHLRELKYRYKHAVMLHRDAQKEVEEANLAYKEGRYPELSPFEYRSRQELNGTLENLERQVSERIAADKLAKLPFSHYYLDYLCTAYPEISEIAAEERTEYWNQASEIAQHNVRLAYSIAKKHSRGLQGILEMMPVGMMGLYNAIDKFDIGRRRKFSSMAVPWIKQAIGRELENQGIVRKPAYLRSVWAKLRHISAENPEFSEEEIQEEFQKRHGELSRYYRDAARQVVPLEAEDGTQRKETSERIDVPGILDMKEKTELIHDALNHLQERERTIIMLRYGLDGTGEHTLEEIGELFELTKERIRQLQKQSLRKLAAYISLEPQHL